MVQKRMLDASVDWNESVNCISQDQSDKLTRTLYLQIIRLKPKFAAGADCFSLALSQLS
jgi:hypothetical protein